MHELRLWPWVVLAPRHPTCIPTVPNRNGVRIEHLITSERERRVGAMHPVHEVASRLEQWCLTLAKGLLALRTEVSDDGQFAILKADLDLRKLPRFAQVLPQFQQPGGVRLDLTRLLRGSRFLRRVLDGNRRRWRVFLFRRLTRSRLRLHRRSRFGLSVKALRPDDDRCQQAHEHHRPHPQHPLQHPLHRRFILQWPGLISHPRLRYCVYQRHVWTLCSHWYAFRDEKSAHRTARHYSAKLSDKSR